ncbi:50S ribosomal protein L6 [Chlamydiales bacterium SCGC AB-751-O23]|jgi:large subunit ribosomal protein L6|nr:50S ribosomal protein L6 [Chlamydiales bacterium SCGC AB-751-O23]
MSRKGKKSIVVPKGTEIKVDGLNVKVKGPKGQLELEVKKGIDITQEGEELFLSYDEKQKDFSKFQGLYRTLICNLIEGANSGFNKQLELIGVGYRATVKGNDLDLSLGFSHPTVVAIPEGLAVKVEKNTLVTISGIDKQKVGQFAAQIRGMKPPEPYKGKGVRYVGEYVRKKAGKTGK